MVDGLWEDPAKNCEHTNSAVLDFSFPQEVEVELVRETEGVEADITGHGAVEL